MWWSGAVATPMQNLHSHQQQRQFQLRAASEQVLPVTYGGWLSGGPENQKLDGQCGVKDYRTALQCDVHNGLPGWDITEITIQVVRAPYREDEQNYYRQRVSIGPFETATVSFKLGMEIPPPTWNRRRMVNHWSWSIAEVKGVRQQ